MGTLNLTDLVGYDPERIDHRHALSLAAALLADAPPDVAGKLRGALAARWAAWVELLTVTMAPAYESRPRGADEWRGGPPNRAARRRRRGPQT